MPPTIPRSLRRRTPSFIAVASFALIALGWFILMSAGFMHHQGDGEGGASRIPADGTPVIVSPTSRQPLSTHTDADDHSSPECVALRPHANVSATLENFFLCFDEEACTGSIRFDFVDRSQCTKKRRSLSSNASLNQFLSEVVGPDLFRFRLEGPETINQMVGASALSVDELVSRWLAHSMASARQDRMAPCSFAITIPALRLGGTYRVGLEWLYRDYAAMDELAGHWPPLLKQSLLEVDPLFSTNYHLQQCTLPSTATVVCKKTTATLEESGLGAACTGRETDSGGRWVVDEEFKGSPVYTRVRVKKIQRNPIVFQWALQSDAARRWVPTACTAMELPAASSPRLSAMMASLAKVSQRIVIGGDSQLRALYFGMSNVLSGFGGACVRNITFEAAEPRQCIPNVKGSQRKVIQGVQLDFVDDLFLDRFTGSERYSSYQTIIVGFAQHPASKEHWTFDKYRASFAAKLRKALQLKASGKHVVWYLAPQYPHTTNGFPVAVRDWRTDLRLKMFNAFAKKECLAHGISVVDAFDISTPFSHTSPDQAHYSNFVSFEFVRMALTVICSQFGGCQ